MSSYDMNSQVMIEDRRRQNNGDDGRIGCCGGKDLIYSDHLVGQSLKELHGSGGDVGGGPQVHGASELCSLGRHAPYFAAWKTSSSSSSGYSRTMSFAV